MQTDADKEALARAVLGTAKELRTGAGPVARGTA